MHAPQGIPYFYWYLHTITLLNSITVQFLYGSTGTLLVWSTSYYKFVRHETAYFCELQWQRQHSETSSDYRCGNALTGGNINNAHGKTLSTSLCHSRAWPQWQFQKCPVQQLQLEGQLLVLPLDMCMQSQNSERVFTDSCHQAGCNPYKL